MRSQSPPRATQRRPVTYVHTAIATSRVRPYMWTVNGPSSSVPELGEGIDARRLTAAAFFTIARGVCPLKARPVEGSGEPGGSPCSVSALRQPLRAQLREGGV